MRYGLNRGEHWHSRLSKILLSIVHLSTESSPSEAMFQFPQVLRQTGARGGARLREHREDVPHVEHVPGVGVGGQVEAADPEAGTLPIRASSGAGSAPGGISRPTAHAPDARSTPTSRNFDFVLAAILTTSVV